MKFKISLAKNPKMYDASDIKVILSHYRRLKERLLFTSERGHVIMVKTVVASLRSWNMIYMGYFVPCGMFRTKSVDKFFMRKVKAIYEMG